MDNRDICSNFTICIMHELTSIVLCDAHQNLRHGVFIQFPTSPSCHLRSRKMNLPAGMPCDSAIWLAAFRRPADRPLPARISYDVSGTDKCGVRVDSVRSACMTPLICLSNATILLFVLIRYFPTRRQSSSTTNRIVPRYRGECRTSIWYTGEAYK